MAADEQAVQAWQRMGGACSVGEILAAVVDGT
jgi:hypothetical protein